MNYHDRNERAANDANALAGLLLTCILVGSVVGGLLGFLNA